MTPLAYSLYSDNQSICRADYPIRRVSLPNWTTAILATSGRGNAEYYIDLTERVLALWGYVEREDELGKRIYEILKDGERHPLTVKMRYPSNESDGAGVLIVELVSEDWLIR